MEIKKEYRASIDGLRCLAVFAVILFHLDKDWLPGGFLGVDIFFVISGYLLTRIIVSDIQSGEFSIVSFYQRRIARIFPAFFLVIASTLAAGILIYEAQDRASLGANSLAAALSLINIKLIFQGNYFSLSEDAQPLLHFWSLAVEEQFYLLFPLMLLLLLKVRALRLTLAIIAILSFVFCVWLSFQNSTFAFYLLPSRAWELLFGGLLALHPGFINSIDRSLMNVLSMTGLVAVVASFWWVDVAFALPGFITAIPILGTLLILAGTYDREFFTTKIFENELLVYFGKMSYSLYLWHWPVFSYVDYVLLEYQLFPRVALKLVLTFTLALATYKLCERPLRSILILPGRKIAAFSMFFLTAVPMSFAGYVTWSTNYQITNALTISDGGRVFDRASEQSVVLIGDSIAAQYADAMVKITRRLNVNLHVMAVPGRNFLPEEKETLWTDTVQAVEAIAPDIVVLSYSSRKIARGPDRIKLALRGLDDGKRIIIVVGDSPRLPGEVSRAQVREGFRGPIFEDDSSIKYRTDAFEVLRNYKSNRLILLDPSSYLKNEDGSIRFMSGSGRTNYHDLGHLTETGVTTHSYQLCTLIRGALPDHPRALRPMCIDRSD